jgi:hypothetical protein
MKNRVLNYILEFGSITTRDAFIDLGCTRLSEYIRQLRLDYDIQDTKEVGINRYGERTYYKRYYIKGE